MKHFHFGLDMFPLKCVTWCESIIGCQNVQHRLCPPRAGITAAQRAKIEMFYLTTHLTHFIYGYMASNIWYRTTQISREKPAAATWATLSDKQQGFFYRPYASPHIQDNTYHGFCYTSHGALAGTRNSSMGPPHEGSAQRRRMKTTFRMVC